MCHLGTFIGLGLGAGACQRKGEQLTDGNVVSAGCDLGHPPSHRTPRVASDLGEHRLPVPHQSTFDDADQRLVGPCGDVIAWRFPWRDAVGFGPYHGIMTPGTDSPLRFVVVTKVAHPWFDEVAKGAQSQADTMSGALVRPIAVEVMSPATATIVAQNEVLEAALHSAPAGIAIDPLGPVDAIPALATAQQLNIPVVVFDAPSPRAGITAVGNDFTEQGDLAAHRLAGLLNGAGVVAVMQGVPDAPNHRQRYEAQLAALAQYPGITVVDGGVDHDDIDVAESQAASVLHATADLRGYLACDASGPIGIARALVAADRVGQVQVVGMDAIGPIAAAVANGVLESSVATIPRMQGAMAILMLWQASLGLPLPRFVDTGIDIVTADNVGNFLDT